MLSRALLLLVTGTLATVACNQTSTPTAVLASVRDSLSQGRPVPNCVRMDGVLSPPGKPVTECRGTVGDTAIVVLTGEENAVTYVGKQWSPPDPDAAFRTLAQSLDAIYGAGERLCYHDVVYAMARVWRREGWYVSAILQPTGLIQLGYATGTAPDNPSAECASEQR